MKAISEAGIYLHSFSSTRHNELPVVIKKYERRFNCSGGSQSDAYPRTAAQTKHIYHVP